MTTAEAGAALKPGDPETRSEEFQGSLGCGALFQVSVSLLERVAHRFIPVEGAYLAELGSKPILRGTVDLGGLLEVQAKFGILAPSCKGSGL